VARLSDHFRDVQQVLPFMIRLWFYGSAVIWPATRLTEKYPELEWVLVGNPAYVFIELVRNGLLDNTWGKPELWLSAGCWSIAALVFGFLFFRSRENEYGHA
jgi:teichoic acid transport system permease protein